MARLIPLTVLLLGATASAAPAPLTLDDALALAARKNYDLALSRLQGESAGVDTYASYANVLPRVDVTTSLGRSYYGPQLVVTTAPVLGTDATGKPTLTFQQLAVPIDGQGINNFGLGLQLKQLAFDGLRSPRLIERAKLSETLAARQLDEAALALSFDVTRRFYEIVKADKSFVVLAETVTRSEEFLGRAESLYEAGRVQKSEVIAARVNLGNDHLNLEGQRARAVQARVDLSLALGVGPGEVGELAPSGEVDRDEAALREPPSAEVLLSRARRARPAFARAQTLLEQAELDRKIAAASWWPVVTGLASYERQGSTFTGNDGVWGNPARQFVATAALNIQFNVFNGRQSLADDQRAAIALRVAHTQAEQLAHQVESDLVRARATVTWLGKAVQLSAENLKAAEEGVRLAQQRLEAGAATQLEVRDAALKLTQAKLTLVNARIDALVARADLNRAAGGAP